MNNELIKRLELLRTEPYGEDWKFVLDDILKELKSSHFLLLKPGEVVWRMSKKDSEYLWQKCHEEFAKVTINMHT